MRKAWLAPVLIVVSIVVQLTVLNGLRLPGGGVPDLVLVLVAALAVADGPLAGVVIGFAAGLCLDIAPPGSPLIGQYALVFCLAGWAAGRLGGAARRSASPSPLRSAVVVAVVVTAAEALSAGLGLVLEPAGVTVAEVRAVLPWAIGYDLVLCPFVLYLVVVASALLADGLAAAVAAAGAAGGSARLQHARERAPRPHQPRLVRAAARTGDGWLSSGHDHHHGRPPSARSRARFRPARGVPGSASGLARRPVRHPGMLAGGSRQFRPRGGEPGGSATRRHGATTVPGGLARGGAPIRFGGRRGDGALGRALTGAHRSAAAGSPPRVVPRVRFRVAAPAPARRPAAVPRFGRRIFRLRAGKAAYGLVPGGVADQRTLAAARRRAGAPRLRLAAGRRGSGPPGGGMLGGSGRSPLRQPRARNGKKPRFGYGRRSLLSLLAGRRAGGNWLARKRAGSRSGLWLIGKRTGGTG